MSKKRLSEKELLEGLTSQNVHSDELATTSEKDLGYYTDATDKADSDFLVHRDDVFDDPRMEIMLKMAERFNENGSIDGETLKKIKELAESKAL